VDFFPTSTTQYFIIHILSTGTGNELFPEISLNLRMDPDLEPDPDPGGQSIMDQSDPDPRYGTGFKYALRYQYPS
jgi:hypothetical protein